MRRLGIAAAMAVFLLGATAAAADSAGGNNWERFKEGAKQAGSAAWSGTKNVAQKTGDAVATGAKKTGEFVAETYEEAKEYVQEKREGRDGEPIETVDQHPAPLTPPEQ